MAQILIVDDELNIRKTLKSALDKRDHQVVTAENIKEAQELIKRRFDIIFLDVMLPDGNGIDLLRETLKDSPDQIFIMISGHADVSTAIEAIKIGAYDFIEKPLSLDRILITIDNSLKTETLKTTARSLSDKIYGDFIGQSSSIKKLKEDITRSAPRTTRFLISGENGTGKELVAHMIHANSQFSSGPFVAVNCAAIPSELVESELFGHTAGAFTGAGKARKGKFSEADKGTIFLDEISEMPTEAQAKILRAVETKTINPVGSNESIPINLNIIAASNKDLKSLVANGQFRQDLLYRLNVVQFNLPPLRERKSDIPLLCEHFLTYFARESKNRAKKLTKDAVEFLMAFDYPGNIRELRNLIERINIYIEKEKISREDIESFLPFVPQKSSSSLKEAVAEFEKKQILSAIEKNGGNITNAANQLGLERSHLYKKMKKYGIES